MGAEEGGAAVGRRRGGGRVVFVVVVVEPPPLGYTVIITTPSSRCRILLPRPLLLDLTLLHEDIERALDVPLARGGCRRDEGDLGLVDREAHLDDLAEDVWRRGG